MRAPPCRGGTTPGGSDTDAGTADTTGTGTGTVADTGTADTGTGTGTGTAGLRWRREIFIVAAFYACYSVVRDIRGVTTASRAEAVANARRVIGLERRLHIFAESSVQQHFVHDHLLIKLCDVYYGSFHFVVTAAVLAYLYVRAPGQYRMWRNTLAITTALALLGYALFPLLPPRLLGAHYHFVDTLGTDGGFWSFGTKAVTHISNQFAAMPSLHTAWSSWCAWALASTTRGRSARLFSIAYPLTTVFCITVTANHYFLDAAAAIAVLWIGHALATLVSSRADRRA